MPKQKRQYNPINPHPPPSPQAQDVPTPCFDGPTTATPQPLEVDDNATFQQPPTPPPPSQQQLKNPIIITIKTTTGKHTTLMARPSDLIESVKVCYGLMEGIPKEMQRLIFGGRTLEDQCTIEDYKITNGALLLLVVQGAV